MRDGNYTCNSARVRYVFSMSLESHVLVNPAASLFLVRGLVYMVATDSVALLMTSVSDSDSSAAWGEHNLKLRNVRNTLSHSVLVVINDLARF